MTTGRPFAASRMALRGRCARIALLAVAFAAEAGAGSFAWMRPWSGVTCDAIPRRWCHLADLVASRCRSGRGRRAAPRCSGLRSRDRQGAASCEHVLLSWLARALHSRRLQRLLTRGWFSGPPSVTEKDTYGYAPGRFRVCRHVCFAAAARTRRSSAGSRTHADTRKTLARADVHAKFDCRT